MMEIEARK